MLSKASMKDPSRCSRVDIVIMSIMILILGVCIFFTIYNVHTHHQLYAKNTTYVSDSTPSMPMTSPIITTLKKAQVVSSSNAKVTQEKPVQFTPIVITSRRQHVKKFVQKKIPTRKTFGSKTFHLKKFHSNDMFKLTPIRSKKNPSIELYRVTFPRKIERIPEGTLFRLDDVKDYRHDKK